MKHKIWLVGKDKIEHILNELKEDAVILSQDEEMTEIEINVHSAVILIKLFYAGYFCATEQSKVLYR